MSAPSLFRVNACARTLKIIQAHRRRPMHLWQAVELLISVLGSGRLNFRLVIFSLCLNSLSFDVLDNLRHKALEIVLVSSDEGNRVVLLAPSRITTDFHALGCNSGSQFGKIVSDTTLGQRCRNNNSTNPFAVRVHQSVNYERLHAFQEVFD